jgi:hypothetical protein
MDEQQLQRTLRSMARLMLAQDSQILDLMTSITVLKLTVAKLQGLTPESSLSEFRDQEAKVLKELPISQQLQECREVLDVLDQHGDALDKNRA